MTHPVKSALAPPSISKKNPLQSERITKLEPVMNEYEKYSPGPLTYASRYVPAGVEDVLDEFSPEQRALLEPPYRPNRPSITTS